MSEDKPQYNLDRVKRDNAVLRKYAAIQKASEEKIGCQKIYVDITGNLESAMILDELIFFTLPRQESGKSGLRVWKDGYLWLASRRTEWWERKRLTERQSDTAIEKLVELGLVVKSVHRFNNLPTVHLRLNVETFFNAYFEALEDANPAEDESATGDIRDLYEMMGFPPDSRICNLQNGDSNSRICNSQLQNGESINNPHTTLTQPSPADFSEIEEKANQAVDQYLAMANFPGAKNEVRVDSILSYLGETLHRDTSASEWRKFAKKIDSDKQLHGWDVKQFIAWLLSQPDYKPQFWPVKKMMEFYPSAFTESGLPAVKIGSDGIPETY